MRKILGVALGMMIATSAFALEAGTWGLGFTDMRAPIGGTYNFTEKVALDLGIGFESFDKGNTNIAFNLGVPIILYAGDRSALQFRPGFYFENFSPDSDDVLGWEGKVYEFQLWLAYKWFATENLALQAAHGITIENTSPKEGDSSMDIMGLGANMTGVGFYFYF